MYKRIFPLLLTLALLLCASPALAADAAVNSAVFYSDGETIIRRESSYELGDVWTCSQDGVTWTEIPGWERLRWARLSRISSAWVGAFLLRLSSLSADAAFLWTGYTGPRWGRRTG